MKLIYKIASYATMVSMALAIVIATLASTVMPILGTGLSGLALSVALMLMVISYISLVIVAVTMRRATK